MVQPLTACKSLIVVSLMLADQTTLSVIGPFSVVFNVVMGRYILNEHVNWLNYLSCVVMVKGSVIALIFSMHQSPVYELSVRTFIDRLSKRCYSDPLCMDALAVMLCVCWCC